MISTDRTRPVPLRNAFSIVPLLLILGLFILRLPFLVGMAILANPLPAWVSPVYEIGTYLLTLLFILWEKDRLADYHIDSLALGIILLFKPIETLILALWNNPQRNFPLAFPGIPSLVIWGIALLAYIYLRRNHYEWQKIRWANSRWLIIGGLSGIALAGVLAYPMSFQADASCASSRPAIMNVIVSGIYQALYQVGYAGVAEEPLFRGILWGFLYKLGWRNAWIWLFQSALFALGHLYYFNSSPISFWMIVPASALGLGLLAWKSHSVATSMAAHGFLNSLGYMAGCILYSFRV
jgi:membrane protease YdiL (CAAX protease family)